MELKVNLKVSANEVFEQLLNLICEDIKDSTGKSITVDKLQKDFTYKKSLRNQLGNEVKVQVKINELIPPARYSVSIEAPKGTNTMEYVLCDTTEGVEITYVEKFKSTSMLQNWNYFLASLVYSRRSKQKVRKQFDYLEQLILNLKDN